MKRLLSGLVPRVRVVDRVPRERDFWGAGAGTIPGPPPVPRAHGLSRVPLGECRDPDHSGLHRLVTEYPSIEPNDRSWMGQDVEVIYLEKQRLLEENRSLRRGSSEHRTNLRAFVCIGFMCGVAFLWVLAVLLGGRPW